MQGDICYKFVNFSTRHTRVLISDRAARTSFLALPLGELAFAQQMTERAAREQIRLRIHLIRILPIDKLPQSCREAAIQLPQRGSQPSLSLRDISPKGRDKTSSREKQTVPASLIPKPARFIY